MIFIFKDCLLLDSARNSPMSDSHSTSQLGLFDTVSGTAISLGTRKVSGLAKEACVEPQPGLIKVILNYDTIFTAEQCKVF